jgi:hypothetical protein
MVAPKHLNLRPTRPESDSPCDPQVPGIIVSRACPSTLTPPRIGAFVWGGKIRPEPVLPFGQPGR